MIYEIVTSYGEYEDYCSCRMYIECDLSKKEFDEILKIICNSEEYASIPMWEVWDRLHYIRSELLKWNEFEEVEIETVFCNREVE